MSKRSSNLQSHVAISDDDAAIVEPPRKIRRYRSGSCGRSALGLCDLHPDMLELIMSKIDISEHSNIRSTSKLLREVNDNFVMRKFKGALARLPLLNPNSEESAVLKVLYLATDMYVRADFSSTFCSCLLPMFCQQCFCPKKNQIKSVLLHFYAMIDGLPGNTERRKSRLLHSLTLIRILREFNNASIRIAPKTSIIIELRGPWFALLWTSNVRSCTQPENCSALLVLLSELLIANMRGTTYSDLVKFKNERYVLGNHNKGKRRPKTSFKFTVYGSSAIYSLLRSYLEDGKDEFVWPQTWPNDEFTIDLDINCPEAQRWGCSRSQHIEFSQHTD